MKKVYYWTDHTPRRATGTGLDRLTRCLARALEGLGRDVVYLRWSARHHAPVRTPDGELQQFALLGGPPFHPRGIKNTALHFEEAGRAQLWRNWLIVPEVPYYSHRGVDLTFELVDYARRNGLQIAFIFYDLIPITLPGYEDRRMPHERYVELLTLADMVIPISRYSAREFKRYCADALKLTSTEMPQVTPVPLPDEFAGHPRAEAASEPSEGPIRTLALGTIEPRKNQLKLLEAFNAFCSEHSDVDARLTLIGTPNPALRAEIQRLAGTNPKIELVPFLPDAALVERFRISHFSVFPSLEEGYGLPIAESLWLGKPCLCANFGSMAEIAERGGCLTVDMRSADELKCGLACLILDKDLRQRLAREAVMRQARLWRDYAAEVLAALEAYDGKRKIFYGFDEIVDNRSLVRRTARTVRFTIGGIAGAVTKAILPEAGPSIESVTTRVPAIRRRRRPCIAFITPYPPDATGAADYIARLLREVSGFADVDVFTDAVRPQCQGGVRFAGPVAAFPGLCRAYDATVPVIGNSRFHEPIARLVGRHGGTCIIHDGSLAMLGRLLHKRNGFRKAGGQFPKRLPDRDRMGDLLSDPSRLTSLFFEDIVYAAQRVIVHSRELQKMLKTRYGIEAEYLPLCPHMEFDDEELGDNNRARIRERLGIDQEQIAIASFGAIQPGKAPRDCILALRLLRSWGVDAHLHFVGAPGEYAGPLQDLCREIGIEPFVHLMSGRASLELYRDCLLAADAGIQLRTGEADALSQALVDVIAAGLPTVASATAADWVEAPSYVFRVPDSIQPAVVAEKLAGAVAGRRDRLQTMSERKTYNRERSIARYSEGLIQILGFG